MKSPPWWGKVLFSQQTIWQIVSWENRALPQQGACGFVLNISLIASMKLSNRAASARVGLCDPRPPLHCELSDVNFESYD